MDRSDSLREINLHAAPESAALAREFVANYLTEHGLSHLVECASQVVSELATNAIVHAQTTFTVSMSQADETVLLRVGDQSGVRPARREPEVTDTGGRGLILVEAFSQAWGVIAGPAASKTIWASFARATALS